MFLDCGHARNRRSEILDVGRRQLGEKGDIQIKDEGEQVCIMNTNILMLREGREIFTRTSQELIESHDLYIHEFIRGTELLPETNESEGQQPPPRNE
jgi:hypothetical protein